MNCIQTKQVGTFLVTLGLAEVTSSMGHSRNFSHGRFKTSGLLSAYGLLHKVRKHRHSSDQLNTNKGARPIRISKITALEHFVSLFLNFLHIWMSFFFFIVTQKKIYPISHFSQRNPLLI
jgi:hypothetical protein